MNVVIQAHRNYSYLDATIVQGFRNLGHTVYSPHDNTANYLSQMQLPVHISGDLFIQCLCGAGSAKDVGVDAPISVMAYGLDNHDRLQSEFKRNFDHIFVRDYVSGPGHPINFAIEDRYYCAVGKNGHQRKTLKNRPIDICFLGTLFPHREAYLNRLEKDLKDRTIVFGGRLFNEPDDVWSPHTLPYCAHDPRYFDMLANSKICLSFKGAGLDCARHWEVVASGAIPIIEEMESVLCAPEPLAMWFDNYETLLDSINMVLDDLDGYEEFASSAWKRNKRYHSTTARALYLLETSGLA